MAAAPAPAFGSSPVYDLYGGVGSEAEGAGSAAAGGGGGEGGLGEKRVHATVHEAAVLLEARGMALPGQSEAQHARWLGTWQAVRLPAAVRVACFDGCDCLAELIPTGGGTRMLSLRCDVAKRRARVCAPRAHLSRPLATSACEFCRLATSILQDGTGGRKVGGMNLQI